MPFLGLFFASSHARNRTATGIFRYVTILDVLQWQAHKI
jgi:hypothetical protein